MHPTGTMHRCGERIFLCAVWLLLAWLSPALAQSVKPTAPAGPYTNSVSFNFGSNTFRFLYGGADGTLEYEYIPAGNGSLNPLRVKVNGAYVVRPANVGGLSLISNATEVFPWQSVSFSLLDAHSNANNVLSTTWKMSSGASNIVYTYLFSMAGRTLTIQVASTNSNSGGLYLDRCEDATNPVVIHVPSLTGMNVLYAGGVFTSLYVDWESAGASTIYPNDSVFSAASVYFSQQALYQPRTDGTRNKVNETIYLTTSPTLTDVLPNVPNPVSPLKSFAAQYIVFDFWQAPFAFTQDKVLAMRNAGVSNLWLIQHVWQNAGFDNKYPDVMPASASWGGDAGLQALSLATRTNGYLFSVHENYVDFYTNASNWNTNAIARESNNALKKAWSNETTHLQSYVMKPALAANYLTNYARLIHTNYTTTASFLDVHSAANPSDKVDYDASVTNAGTFREVLTRYRALASLLRTAHNGPVSGEGNHHYLFTGYFDDIEAQLNVGSYAPFTSGQWLPLLVDFDLRKLHDKALLHGVGYYERYFCTTNGASDFSMVNRDKVLTYMAAELVYGRGGFVPTQDRTYDFTEVGKLEQRHVFPAQKLYYNTMPVSILYRDPGGNDLVTASDYIRRYPTTFDKAASSNFMSQVCVTYDNGMVVCVNRHPTQPWTVTLGHPGGNFNFNAVLNGTNTQWVGVTNFTTYTLPATNGWVVFAPDLTPPVLTNVVFTNGALRFALTNLLAGNSNRIERSFTLASNSWQPVDTFVSTGTQTNWSQTGTATQAYYRAVRFW